MYLPYYTAVLVCLFALAFGGALWTAWIKTPITPRYVCSFIAFMALAAADVALILAQS